MSDRLRLEVFHHLFAATAEEMGVSLMRSAFSPNIKERRDFSCALFDGRGRMIAQAAHLPVHLGSAPLSVEAAMARIRMEPGDAVLLNDPFQGGTHLPDITLVSPVFLPGEVVPSFYVANRAHHADVGGAHPGSMAPARDVHAEGLRIPPTRLARAGTLDRELLDLLLANMRVPREREGDLMAQWAANQVGARRLIELTRAYGASELRRRGTELRDWTAQLAAALLAELPRGEWRAEDRLELGGGLELALRLRLERNRHELVFDLRESDDQTEGSVNTTRGVAISAAFYVLRCLLPPGTPTNEGVLRQVRVLTRPGSVLEAQYPAPVAAGNVETSQRLVDVLLLGLAQALPGRIPAASSGTMSNLTLGGPRFAYYETLPGGAGGGPQGAGAHAVQTHMTNTRSTPIEALEKELPVRVVATTVRRGSGGAGRARGGDGLVRRLLLLAPVRISFTGQRQARGPYGLEGGAAGAPGRARWRAAGERRWRSLGVQAALDLAAGAEIEVETPGGGGFGA